VRDQDEDSWTRAMKIANQRISSTQRS